MIDFLLDLIFPKHSLLGTEGAWITKEERSSMRLFPTLLHREQILKRGLKSVDCIIAAGSFSSTPLLQKTIHAFKYHRVHSLASELADRIKDALPGLLMLPEKYRQDEPVLCPVPLHWTRRFHRGFNQAEVLAVELGKIMGWKVLHLLKRTRSTGYQAHRNRSDRLTAMEGAFAFGGDRTSIPPVIFLVDDVCTTGATLESCAKELKRAGAKYVVGLVAANG